MADLHKPGPQNFLDPAPTDLRLSAFRPDNMATEYRYPDLRQQESSGREAPADWFPLPKHESANWPRTLSNAIVPTESWDLYGAERRMKSNDASGYPRGSEAPMSVGHGAGVELGNDRVRGRSLENPTHDANNVPSSPSSLRPSGAFSAARPSSSGRSNVAFTTSPKFQPFDELPCLSKAALGSGFNHPGYDDGPNARLDAIDANDPVHPQKSFGNNPMLWPMEKTPSVEHISPLHNPVPYTYSSELSDAHPAFPSRLQPSLRSDIFGPLDNILPATPSVNNINTTARPSSMGSVSTTNNKDSLSAARIAFHKAGDLLSDVSERPGRLSERFPKVDSVQPPFNPFNFGAEYVQTHSGGAMNNGGNRGDRDAFSRGGAVGVGSGGFGEGDMKMRLGSGGSRAPANAMADGRGVRGGYIRRNPQEMNYIYGEMNAAPLAHLPSSDRQILADPLELAQRMNELSLNAGTYTNSNGGAKERGGPDFGPWLDPADIDRVSPLMPGPHGKPVSAPASLWPASTSPQPSAGTANPATARTPERNLQSAPSSLGRGETTSKMPASLAHKGLNPPHFDLNPVNARFFVIKSYTEDDVHKSLKYDIWASTEIGNRRLDKAFRENENKGPIYLFFSVNTSGHFCGMAQMITPVDYSTSSNVWAQDKWKGVFKVRWIFVKDIPNAQLRHIRVINNDNKPVTNSRDTQEIFAEPGCEMLRMFYEYRNRTSILDDFEWYDQKQTARGRES
ncbi:uncharacterized protein VTP21DRAFT_11112 [Calcarisporiella thermophila]|uniref:uncharacterized protein n=1 Tax=Calcarisporiella thermophila TaxID=911321 RepID=UPI00374456E7